jgi:hypothetical protein
MKSIVAIAFLSVLLTSRPEVEESYIQQEQVVIDEPLPPEGEREGYVWHDMGIGDPNNPDPKFDKESIRWLWTAVVIPILAPIVTLYVKHRMDKKKLTVDA